MNGNLGACGCGAVNYKINEDIISIINCHCNMCRQHNGTAFTSYVIVPSESLEITNGSAQVGFYKKDNATKHFCNRCGTPLYNAHDKYEQIRLVYLGTLIENKALKPKLNIWCENQLSWIPEIGDIKSTEHGS